MKIGREFVPTVKIRHPLQPKHHFLACVEIGQHYCSYSILRQMLFFFSSFPFFLLFFFFRLMNAPTKCVYASLVPHWRRWCHLSARLVTSQGVYCHPKVSYLKWHSQKDKWQDVALCTCSGQRKLSGPKHISSTDPERQIHSVLRKVSAIVY